MKSIVRFLVVSLSLGFVAAQVSALPSEAQPAYVDSLVPAYLELQTALADDDLPSAQNATKALLAAAAQGPAFAELTGPAEAIADAGDIKTAQASFLTVSNEMIALVDQVGTSSGHALYVAHCPMAFRGQGGSWLQSDQKVANPYYGSMMFRCGSIKKSVGN